MLFSWTARHWLIPAQPGLLAMYIDLLFLSYADRYPAVEFAFFIRGIRSCFCKFRSITFCAYQLVLGLAPVFFKAASIASALSCDNFLLMEASPLLSVYPPILIFNLG